MSITPVPISMRLVRAPIAASNGKGEASCRAKWWTRKYAPSIPSSSAATASSIDCSRASDAERVRECGDGFQWPKERKPIFFIASASHPHAAAPRLGLEPGGELLGLQRVQHALDEREVKPADQVGVVRGEPVEGAVQQAQLSADPVRLVAVP